MKKFTLALPAVALTALTIGLAAPAAANAAISPAPTASIATIHGGYPLDCGVHVNYQGANVDVNWC